MRIAIIADIHGNLEALEAVLKDISNKNVDDIVCLGDLVGYAANPNEVVDLIKKKGIRCIKGNHDLNAVTLEKLDWFNERAQEALKFTNKVLTEENKKFLMDLPETLELKDKNKLFAVHGSPKDPLYEYLDPTVDEDLIKDMLDEQKADVLVCAHTHLPDLKRFELKVFLNPGSVGQPRNNNSKSQYAILDLGNINFVSFETVEYDIDTAAKKIIQAGLPRFLADRLYVGR
ncbi:metallophosphoesterase family protein [Candidatus Woesearchaeota archaeon]|nr:metallophosphoesterase family protein [Candidatus Woesearchaeota archaeon]